MKDGKIEYELIRVAMLEREVIGQLASGDAEGLEENLRHATEFLETMERILKETESSPKQERNEGIKDTVEGLKRVIKRIGEIKTTKCEGCGDQVLTISTTWSEDGRWLCKSCIDAYKTR